MFQKLRYWVGSVGLLVVMGCDTEPLLEVEPEQSASVAPTERRASVEARPPADGDLPEPTSGNENFTENAEPNVSAQQVVAPSRWPDPVEKSHEIEMSLHELLASVIDNESAQQAVAPLTLLTEKAQGRTKALWLWVATAPKNEVGTVFQERGKAILDRFPDGGQGSLERAIEIAQRPENTEFRGALLRLYEQMIAESPPTAGGKLREMVQPLR